MRAQGLLREPLQELVLELLQAQRLLVRAQLLVLGLVRERERVRVRVVLVVLVQRRLLLRGLELHHGVLVRRGPDWGRGHH